MERRPEIFDVNTAARFFNNDPVFHAFVKSMVNAINNLQLTPSEVRAAAMYACYINELYNPASKVFYEGANGDQQ